MTDKKKIACPNCGSADHIYAHADARWNNATQEWEIRHHEEMLDCMNCDHEWLYRDSFA
jgi:predicted RNA-binding Zn-ribbon protein involved in translation (DUF1610 family)